MASRHSVPALRRFVSAVLLVCTGLSMAATAQAPITDMATLEQRFAKTDAVGLFTKLSVKGDATDLYEAFRAHHDGRPKPTLLELEERYEVLVQMIIVMLQNKDPELARAISAAREPLWESLSDPVRFRAL